MSEKAVVWSCGGGVQSAAIAALICRGRLPKPDISIMVDTGREKETTWQYVNGVLIPNLRRAGVELVVVKKEDFATVDLYSKKSATLLLPVYTETGKFSTFCSGEWKVAVKHRYLRSLGIKKYYSWLGISCDELRRVRVSRTPAEELRYPLIEEEFGLSYRRENCVEEVRRAGWGDAPRSSCWMCPNQSDAEWLAMTPDDLERAGILESEIRAKDDGFFLHRSRVPIRDVVFSDNKPGHECEGMCFV